MRRTIVMAVAALFLVGACSDEPTGLDSSTLTIEDSCGESFTVRDPGGTQRLTISPSPQVREGSAAGVFDLGHEGWTGELEIGAGLEVWPCHDVGSDFEGERVAEVWTVVGGSVELLDDVPTETDGAGAGTIRARIDEVVLESPNGSTATMTDIGLVNSRWGFYGG